MLDPVVSRGAELLKTLEPHLVSLKKYESNFSPEACQLLENMLRTTANFKASVEGWPDEPGMAGYLLTGGRTEDFKTRLNDLGNSLSALLGGSMPLPRSAKEDLQNMRTELKGIKIDFPFEQAQQVTRLRELYAEVTDEEKEHDVDLIEANLDEVVQQVKNSVLGSESLSVDALKLELVNLEIGVENAKASGNTSDAAVLSLAVNSMQRLHASQLGIVESEEEEEEDVMGMVTDEVAIKMADASKFSSLAQPLTPTEGKPFMIELEPEGALGSRGGPISPVSTGGPRASWTGEGDDAETPGLTAEDFEPIPAEAQLQSQHIDSDPEAAVVAAASVLGAAAAAGAAIAAAIGAGDGPGTAVDVIDSPSMTAPAGSGLASPGAAAPDEAEAAAVVDTDGGASATERKALTVDTEAPDAAVAAAAAAAAAGAVAVVGPDGQIASPGEEKLNQFVNFLQAPPGEEKLNQFVNFLQDKNPGACMCHAQMQLFIVGCCKGENPGACMFHAQMRLSTEGCRKLSNFLKNSFRVRALSLSHNYLGDDGIATICEGLRVNKSITALDLPDNNISDIGIQTLANSIGHNPSLTQLQLSYNKVGDAGAQALAELIKSSTSLKKLGLSFNNIGKAGCQALTLAISSNQSLKHLQILPGNPVEEKDAKALAKALKHNKKFSIRSFLGMPK
eukprot:gene25708-11366_t